MRLWIAMLAMLAMPVAGQTDALEQDTCSAPPCGYILPTLDILVEDKLACGGGQIIYATEPPEDCYPILVADEERTVPAKLIWKWEMSEDGTYPKEVGQDILIGFSGTGTNVPWLSVDVVGEGMVDDHYVIDDAALVDPANIRQMPNQQGQDSVWFWYERDIDITFTRTGDPDPDSLQRIEDRQGILSFFVKGQSSDSGPRFKEGFGIEEFRFNACEDDSLAAALEPCPTPAGMGPIDEDAPGIPLIALLAMLVVLVRRRSSGR